MSDIEEAVAAALANNSGVTDLVGSSPPRIYASRIAQNSALPALTYQLISDVSVNSHGGPSGLAWARMQFDSWAQTKEEARELSRAVRIALAGIRDNYAGMSLQGAEKINEQSLPDPDARLRRRTLDMRIGHSEDQVA